ncbi:MAG: hypothetical protein ABSF22_04260 [Bryobacteraceae bacterium]
MISLTSKQSAQISFIATPRETVTITPPLTMIIESGVAVFSFAGTHANDWTRDTLAFPVGEPCTEALFLSGIAAASPASFWMPLEKGVSTSTSEVNVEVSGADSAGNPVTLGGSVQIQQVFPPPIGCAVDSATVAYSAADGQPVLTLALAVFGETSFLIRVSYTAHIAMAEHRSIVVQGGATTVKQA